MTSEIFYEMHLGCNQVFVWRLARFLYFDPVWRDIPSIPKKHYPQPILIVLLPACAFPSTLLPTLQEPKRYKWNFGLRNWVCRNAVCVKYGLAFRTIFPDAWWGSFASPVEVVFIHSPYCKRNIKRAPLNCYCCILFNAYIKCVAKCPFISTGQSVLYVYNNGMVPGNADTIQAVAFWLRVIIDMWL